MAIGVKSFVNFMLSIVRKKRLSEERQEELSFVYGKSHSVGELLTVKLIRAVFPIIITFSMFACIPYVVEAESLRQIQWDDSEYFAEVKTQVTPTEIKLYATEVPTEQYNGQATENEANDSGNKNTGNTDFENATQDLGKGMTTQNQVDVGLPLEITDTYYRIQPLLKKLAALDQSSIDANAGSYSDMAGHWSRNIVGKLTALDIITGANGRFMPDRPVQADQFIKMAIAALGHKAEQGKEYWAQPYIDIALKEGIVEKGEIEDYRKPITREKMAAIIVRAAMKAEEKPDGEYDMYVIGKVSDYEAVDDKLKQYVIDAYKLGLVTGSGGKFRPKNTLTRAEAAAVILRLLDKTERKPMKPSENEIIRLNDTRGNPVVLYPSAIRELFDVAKAAQKAIPKAKGYVRYTIGADGKFVGAAMYKDEATYKASIYNLTASFIIAYNDEENTYAYTLTVWDDELYKEYFPDYIREIFKTIFEKEAQKAIELHDKYMNARYTRTDGYNDYTVTSINNRNTCFLRYDDFSFGIQIKLKGLK